MVKARALVLAAILSLFLPALAIARTNNPTANYYCTGATNTDTANTEQEVAPVKHQTLTIEVDVQEPKHEGSLVTAVVILTMILIVLVCIL